MTETKKQNVPALRFPEFVEEWVKTKLGNITDQITSGSRDWSKYYAKSGDKFIRMANLQRDENIQLNLEDLKFVALPRNSTEGARTSLQAGDILISITAELGKIGLVPEGLGTAYINQHTALARPILRDIAPTFLAQNLARRSNNIRLNRLNDAGAKAGLNLGTIKTFPLFLPSLPEQKKIAAFLSAVDRKIGQLSRKKQLLEQYKKGMMQKLFSQELRFKDDNGNDFPDWAEKKVSDVFQITRGNVLAVPKMTPTPQGKSVYPVYSSQTKNNGLTGFFPEYLYEDAITWTTDGANAGDVKYREGKFYCTNVCGVLISKDGFANNCIAEMLNRITEKFVSYVGNPKLMNNVMAQIKVSYPHPDEQQKIATFLSSLDRKIDLVTLELTHAKAFKKGLLQQMFV